MGRGRGAAEVGDGEKAAIMSEEPRQRTDDSDEEEAIKEEEAVKYAAKIQAEKTIEQLLDEAHKEWTRFFYAPWAGYLVWGMFIVSIVNMVLTLDQWHGTRGWRLPIDFLPLDRRYGGWPQINHSIRFSGAIIGVLGSAFCWVMKPNSDLYKCLFLFLFVSSLMLFIGFGYDFYELQRAQSLPFCGKIPDMQTHRYICTFEDYQATLLIEFVAAAWNIFMACYICRLSLTGAVSRISVWHEQKGKFEKKTPDPAQSTLNLFPRRFRLQWPRMNLMLLFGSVLNISIVALSTTQSTGIYLEQGTGYNHPIYNHLAATPLTLFVVHGDEYGPRVGSWPQNNFDFRLSTGAVAIVITAFLIQWRRDGRSTQLFVIGIMIFTGAMWLACAGLDMDLIFETGQKGCQWMYANGYMCLQRRYLAVGILDCFLGVMFTGFSWYSLWSWFQQAKKPGNPWSPPDEIEAREAAPTHEYGWYYNGEWQHKESVKAQELAEEKAKIAKAQKAKDEEEMGAVDDGLMEKNK